MSWYKYRELQILRNLWRFLPFEPVHIVLFNVNGPGYEFSRIIKQPYASGFFMFVEALDSDLLNWVILPLAIFLARVFDVTLQTMRIIFVAQGKRNLAPLFGFVEVLVWVVAMGQIMSNLANPICYVAYAAGFAAGNYIGLTLEGKLAFGMVAVRVILIQQADELVARLREAGFGATLLPAYGASGQVGMIFTIIKRKDLEQVVNLIQAFNPKAFYTIEEVRSASQGYFPPSANYHNHISFKKNK